MQMNTERGRAGRRRIRFIGLQYICNTTVTCSFKACKFFFHFCLKWANNYFIVYNIIEILTMDRPDCLCYSRWSIYMSCYRSCMVEVRCRPY